jgi:hypothetical protein
MAARHKNAQIYFRVVDKTNKETIKLGPRGMDALFNNEFNGYGNKVDDGVKIEFWRITCNCGHGCPPEPSVCDGVARVYPSKFMDPTKVNDSGLLPVGPKELG